MTFQRCSTRFFSHRIPVSRALCLLGAMLLAHSAVLCPAQEQIQGVHSVPAAAAPRILHNPNADSALRVGADPALPRIPTELRSLILDGYFSIATAQLKEMLAKPELPAGVQREDVQWQIEKLQRIAQDYDLSREDLVKKLRSEIRDFQDIELDQWIAGGLVDRMVLNGEERFFGATISNLAFLSPEIRARKIGADSDSKLGRFVLTEISRLRKQYEADGKSPLAPRQFRVYMNHSVHAPASREGQQLHSWMPFPREFPFQTDIRLVESFPTNPDVAPPDALQRTVHFKQTVKAEQLTSYSITYEYTSWARVTKLDIGKADWLDPNSPLRREWTREEPPHVVFVPELRVLYQEIAGEDRNPTRLARKFYEWISENIRYSYAREYSTLDNISLYCAARRAGDCGQEALLFITLCRMAGIPARWQSGWTCYPHWKGMHDWTEIYLEPHGWIPVDPYMGIWAAQYLDRFTEAERRTIRDFYFGNMDAYRLTANAAHQAPFQPLKKGWRSDTVDNQRGEMEWADATNLYFNEFKRKMVISEATTPAVAQQPMPAKAGAETRY